MRVILYTGKGGVGKTTLSAATAVAAAQAGRRSVVMSIDAAHSLSDAFGTSLGSEPVNLAPNLDALEIDVHHELEKNWHVISRYIKKFLTSQGYDEVVAEELVVMPGMDELFSLLRLLDFAQSDNYDLAVVDCAPTGSTLQFLAFSDVIDWYMTRFFDLERRIVKAVKPIAEKIIKAPLPTDDVFFSVEGIYERLLAVKRLLSDPTRSSVRVVTNPEKMVVTESRRAYLALSLFGFPVDCVIANRLFPPQKGKDYFSNWRKLQSKNMENIREAFAPLPIRTCKMYDSETIGIEMLGQLAKEVFNDDDPSAVLFNDRPFQIDELNGQIRMRLKLPGASKDQIELWTKKDELIITVDGRRRNLLLPRSMQGRSLVKASFENDLFTIIFESGEA